MYYRLINFSYDNGIEAKYLSNRPKISDIMDDITPHMFIVRVYEVSSKNTEDVPKGLWVTFYRKYLPICEVP